jgi:Protein of unknown function (DUF4236)
VSLRFFRRIRLVPGVRINLSKSRPSVSVGRPGMWLTVGGKRGTRTTVGLPGTGLFWTQASGPQAHAPRANLAMGLFCVGVLVALVALIIFAG